MKKKYIGEKSFFRELVRAKWMILTCFDKMEKDLMDIL